MTKQFVCVHCNKYVKELYRRYTSSVLKLHSCESCHNAADKYIEYDQVVVLIDLVLFNREAYRHVLFNSLFKNHWKLAIIILLLKTYYQWINLSTDLLGLSPSYVVTEHSFYLSAAIAISSTMANLVILFTIISVYDFLAEGIICSKGSLFILWKAFVLSNIMSWFLILPILIWRHPASPINFILFSAYFVISQTQALSVTCSVPRWLLLVLLCFTFAVESLMLLKSELLINYIFYIK